MYQNGEVVFAKGYGLSDLERSRSITPETVFDIASNSKQFAAFSILLLEHRGLLSLDDDVRLYVPELPDFGASIRIRHLIHNTSGLRDFGELRELSGVGIDQQVNRREFLELLARQRSLNFPPGEQYLYSNTNWVLAALIVERVDGRASWDFLAQEVFEPLGMSDTRVRHDPDIAIANRAVYYTPQGDGSFRVNHAWQRTSGIDGMSFIHTTLGDLARWDANFYTEQVGGRGMTNRMYERGRLNSGETISYAAGLMVGELRGVHAIWHGGYGGGSSQLMRFPDQRLSVAVLSNQYHTHIDTHELCLQIAELYLELEEDRDPMASETVSVADDELARYAGEYWIESQVRFTRFVSRDGMLWEMDGDAGYPMRPIGNGRFQDEYEEIAFAPDAMTGRGVSRDSGIEYDLERRVDWRPTAAELNAYSGTYYSSELGHQWHIVVSNETLALSRRRKEQLVFETGQPGCFVAPGLRLRFERSDDGAATRVFVSTERILDLEFVRHGSG